MYRSVHDFMTETLDGLALECRSMGQVDNRSDFGLSEVLRNATGDGMVYKVW